MGRFLAGSNPELVGDAAVFGEQVQKLLQLPGVVDGVHAHAP